MNKDEIIEDIGILRFSPEKYIEIKNDAGKKWVLPRKSLRTSLELYQPSSWKGKILKIALPSMYAASITEKLANRVLHITDTKYRPPQKLLEVLDHFYAEKSNLSVSYFLGTPSVHQKVTVQVASDNQIMSYFKITDNIEIGRIFHNEKKLLDRMHKVQLYNVPRCLYCDTDENGISIFGQSTVKTGSSKVIHSFGQKHRDFLTEMSNKTLIHCRYENSDYYKMLRILETQISVLSKAGFDTMCITDAIVRVDTGLKETTEFCVYHGDFTPWNTFVEQGKLFVFDFEYAKLSYPKYLDFFHFYTQTAIFEKHWDADRIVNELDTYIPNGMFDNYDLSFEMYLLAIIQFYTQREHGDFTGDISICMDTWIKLLKKMEGKMRL